MKKGAAMFDFVCNSLYGALMAATDRDRFTVTGETLKRWLERFLAPASLAVIGAALWQIFWGIPSGINDNKVEIRGLIETGKHLSDGLRELKEDDRRLRKNFDEARRELSLDISGTEAKLLKSLREQRMEIDASIRHAIRAETYRLEFLMREWVSKGVMPAPGPRPSVDEPKDNEKKQLEEKKKLEKQ